MTTVTLEVSDDLARRIEACKDQAPMLLAKTFLPSAEEIVSPAILAAATHSVYREMLDFLATQPSPYQIEGFKLSADASDRLSELLEKNREEGLTREETAELDVFELVHHSLLRLKAKARSANA